MGSTTFTVNAGSYPPESVVHSAQLEAGQYVTGYSARSNTSVKATLNLNSASPETVTCYGRCFIAKDDGSVFNPDTGGTGSIKLTTAINVTKGKTQFNSTAKTINVSNTDEFSSTKGQHINFSINTPNYGTLPIKNTYYNNNFSITYTTNDKHTLSISVNPSGSGTTSGGGSFYKDISSSISATAAAGYKFSGWTTSSGGSFGNASSSSTTYVMPDNTASIVANFTKQSYTLTTAVSPSGAGSVTAGDSIQYGSTKSLTATAATGYTFSSWSKTSGTLSSTTSNPTTFTMGTSAATVTANFTHNQYTLTLSKSPSAGGSVSGGGTKYYNDSCSISATAATGYAFKNWTTSSGGTIANANSASTTYTMPNGNATVTANFTHTQYTLTLSKSPSAGGSVSGGGTKYYNDSCSITATPATGYSFVNWTTSSGGTIANANSASTTYTMPNGNATVTANFSINSYALTVQASPSVGGTVTGSGTFEYGSTNNITATAATGYQFNGWTTTSGTLGNASSASTTLTLGASAATVTANFVKIDYSVTTAANPAGTGTVSSNAATAQMGDTVTLTQTPARGYEFESWNSVPSVEITNDQFVMPASNITITANYIVANKLYYKDDGEWVQASCAYKKTNGTWVLQDDLSTVFNSNTKYIKGN